MILNESNIFPNAFDLCYNNEKSIGCDFVSVVLAVCGNNYLKMVSDGRVVKISNLSENVIYNEHFNKLKRVNKKVVLGFGGDKLLGEKTIKKLKLLLQGRKMESIKLEEVSILLQCLLRELELGMLKVQFIIGGRGYNNKMGMCILNSDNDFQPEYIFPDYGNHQVKVILPFKDHKVCEELISEFFNPFPTDAIQLDKTMIEFVRKVATIDETVNTNIYSIQVLEKH